MRNLRVCVSQGGSHRFSLLFLLRNCDARLAYSAVQGVCYPWTEAMGTLRPGVEATQAVMNDRQIDVSVYHMLLF